MLLLACMTDCTSQNSCLDCLHLSGTSEIICHLWSRSVDGMLLSTCVPSSKVNVTLRNEEKADHFIIIGNLFLSNMQLFYYHVEKVCHTKHFNKQGHLIWRWKVKYGKNTWQLVRTVNFVIYLINLKLLASYNLCVEKVYCAIHLCLKVCFTLKSSKVKIILANSMSLMHSFLCK